MVAEGGVGRLLHFTDNDSWMLLADGQVHVFELQLRIHHINVEALIPETQNLKSLTNSIMVLIFLDGIKNGDSIWLYSSFDADFEIFELRALNVHVSIIVLAADHKEVRVTSLDDLSDDLALHPRYRVLVVIISFRCQG
jgi:hypothetical protein